MSVVVSYKTKIGKISVSNAEYNLVWNLNKSAKAENMQIAIIFIQEQYNLNTENSENICSAIYNPRE